MNFIIYKYRFLLIAYSRKVSTIPLPFCLAPLKLLKLTLKELYFVDVNNILDDSKLFFKAIVSDDTCGLFNKFTLVICLFFFKHQCLILVEDS